MKTETETETIEVPCQNCQKLITVPVPFIGCPFCEDCTNNRVMWSLGTEHFNYNET